MRRSSVVFCLALLVFPAGAAEAHHKRVLRPGDTGPQVAAWQHILNTAIGQRPPAPPPLEMDGVFGPRTERATKWFERKWVGCRVDGVVTTADRLAWLGTQLTSHGARKPDLYRGVTSPLVAELQVGLNHWIERQEVSIDPLWIDAIFGPRTRTALIAFQTGSGLRADGIAGPEVTAELLRRGLLALPTAPCGSPN